MPKLSRQTLGRSVHCVVYIEHKTAAAAARATGIDEFDLRRAWGRGNQASRHMSMTRLIEYLDKLGYEVHFELIKK
jgi:hypothetical protein